MLLFLSWVMKVVSSPRSFVLSNLSESLTVGGRSYVKSYESDLLTVALLPWATQAKAHSYSFIWAILSKRAKSEWAKERYPTLAPSKPSFQGLVQWNPGFRGMKGTLFEGGTRGAGFVSGGRLQHRWGNYCVQRVSCFSNQNWQIKTYLVWY